MRVLIAGGCGYIGSALYRHLQRQGHEVDSVDRELRGNAGITENQLLDYTHQSRFDDWDAVIVMAGHSSVKQAADAPYAAFSNNLVKLGQLTQRLNGQPLIYASSGACLADTKILGRNMYDVTKRAIDEIVPLLYPQSYGLRFATVAGPSPNMRTDTLLNAMVRDALRMKRISMSNPRVWRPVLAMDDLLAGIDLILEGGVVPRIHNMCSVNCSIAEVAEAVSEQLYAEIIPQPDSPTYDFRMTRAHWMRPEMRLTDMITQLVAHYETNGLG